MLLKVNPNFKDLIPPLSEDELKGLEESILAHGGCRDTIKVWRNTILDGHNRYAICQKHGLPYETERLRFSCKKDAELWIVQNQLGRRNLVNAMRIKLALHKEALLREKAKANRSGCQGETVHVRKIIAQDARVSEQTVQRYIRIRELGDPELLQKIESGLTKIGTAYREAVADGDGRRGVGGAGKDRRQDLGLAGKPTIEVTVRTVESFYGAKSAKDISDPYYEAAVKNNLDRLVKLYGFMEKHVVDIQLDSKLSRARNMLRRQLSQLLTRCVE